MAILEPSYVQGHSTLLARNFGILIPDVVFEELLDFFDRDSYVVSYVLLVLCKVVPSEVVLALMLALTVMA